MALLQVTKLTGPGLIELSSNWLARLNTPAGADVEMRGDEVTS
jgi:hypothetical protein